MIKKYLHSMFSDESNSSKAFEVTKRISDYVGALTRIAFIVLIDRLIWAMFENGNFGDNGYWFAKAVMYIASGYLWVIMVALMFSLGNVTYRVVVEVFDEVTGFDSASPGLVLLILRMGVAVMITIYGGLVVLAGTAATQNITKFLAHPTTLGAAGESKL
ncbi:hypothetical protein [Rhizobium leguminosarum]|uniref:hypothetical protein n=1 Tax=Rhizobium leguminosarum TaxID=384 RepID=UPI000487515C|nr:hypothetical protein [Rhizobium leguminosarum]